MNPGKGLQGSDRSLGHPAQTLDSWALCDSQSAAAPSVGRAERSTLLQGSALCSSTALGLSELFSNPLAVAGMSLPCRHADHYPRSLHGAQTGASPN